MSLAPTTHPERRVLLRNISWAAYQAIRQSAHNEHVKMAFDRGVLELMAPSKLHEQLARLIDRMVRELTMELSMTIQSCGSWTLQREDDQRGCESDNCYYIANEPLVRDRHELNLAQDPPPDLAIEIDLSSDSLSKLPIYATIGIPELWRYDGEQVQFYELRDETTYGECERSLSFPELAAGDAAELLDRRHGWDENAWTRMVRDWIHDVYVPRTHR